MSTLAPNSLIVITGITGFIAQHTGLEALKAGYRVRGTLRDIAKGDELRAAYTKQGVDASPAKLEFVFLNDMLSEAQYANAFKGADAVVHIALPDFAEDWVNKVIESVQAPLRVAAREPSIKRFVLSSSSGAIIMPGQTSDKVLTDKDWNERDIAAYNDATEEMKKSGLSWYFINYGASKTMSEQAAWKFMETHKPGFEFSTILPMLNFGPVLYGPVRITAALVSNLAKGDASSLQIPTQWYVDVRDDARIHVLAATQPELGGKRIWAAAAPFGWNEVLAILRKNFPDAKIPADVEGPAGEPNTWKIDSEVARKALGGKWIPFEDSVVDLVKSVGY